MSLVLLLLFDYLGNGMFQPLLLFDHLDNGMFQPLCTSICFRLILHVTNLDLLLVGGRAKRLK